MTTAKKTTTRKPAAKKTLTAKTKKTVTAKPSSAKPATPKVITPVVQANSEMKPPSLRKKELIDAVVLRSGIKKKDAKPVIEAMLEVLGEHVAMGKEMNLQPFGKVLFKKQTDKASAVVSVARIRQAKAAQKPKIPAQAAE